MASNPRLVTFRKVLEEARKHKSDTLRSIDSLHFNLQNPISKRRFQENPQVQEEEMVEKCALVFPMEVNPLTRALAAATMIKIQDVHCEKLELSGPVNITESRSTRPPARLPLVHLPGF